MAAKAEFRTSRGGDPVRLVVDLTSRILPDESDLQFALENQRKRILERTAQGVDFEGKTFAPYSQKGPYYFYPSTQRGRTFQPAARLLSAIWAGRSTFRSEYFKVLNAAAKRFKAKLGDGAGGNVQTRGGGIRFESYADFKAKLGHSVVDLTGPRAPHMLQAMVVKMRSGLEGAIGIYGDEAARASGHHEGNPRTKLPKRRFLGASTDDQKSMLEEMGDRATERWRERIGG